MPTYRDFSGAGLDGTVLSALTWGVAGPTDAMRGVSFAGLGQPPGGLARTASVPAIPVSGAACTVEFWLRQRNRGTLWQSPIGWGTQDFLHYVDVDFYDYGPGTVPLVLEIYNDWNLTTGLGPPPLAHDGTWHYVAITTDGVSTSTFYVNGVLCGTLTTGTVTGTSWTADSIALGSGPFGWGEFLIGDLAAVAVYAHILPDCRIAAHYAASGRRNLATDLEAELAPDPLYARVYPLAGHIPPAGSRSAVHVPWAFTRGTYLQPQHQPRTLATPEGASPLRAIAVGDTTTTDAVLAPDDQNVAYWVDWTNTLPEGITIASASTQILMRPSAATAWSAATDVTLAFLTSTTLDSPQIRVVLADGSQTLGQQYRVRILATFSNSPATVLEAFFDLTVAET